MDETETKARIEGLARVMLLLLVELEDRGAIDGQHFQERVRSCLPGGSPMLDRAAVLMDELMTTLSASRAVRRRRALWSENLTGKPGDRT